MLFKWLEDKDKNGDKMVYLENGALNVHFFDHMDDEDEECQGVLVNNTNNGVLSWNAQDITHLNFIGYKFNMMYDYEQNTIMLSADENHNIIISLEKLVELVKLQGKTVEEIEKEYAKQEEENGSESAESAESE